HALTALYEIANRSRVVHASVNQLVDTLCKACMKPAGRHEMIPASAEAAKPFVMTHKTAAPLHLQSVSKDPEIPFRQAPHNIEAEQALLGAILINNESFDRISSFLTPSHFFEPLHARIFETTAKLIQSGKHATPITIK